MTRGNIVGLVALSCLLGTAAGACASTRESRPVDSPRAARRAAVEAPGEPLAPPPVVAFVDLSIVAADPRLSALGLDGVTRLLGVPGVGRLGGTPGSATLSAWPTGVEPARGLDTVLRVNGLFDAKVLRTEMAAAGTAPTTLDGAKVYELTLPDAKRPSYLRLLNETSALIGTAEGLRRGLATDPAVAAVPRTGVPVGAAAWLVMTGAALAPGPHDPDAAPVTGLLSKVRGLTVSVNPAAAVEMRARITFVDAAAATGCAAALRLLPLLLATGAPDMLRQTLGKLSVAPDGVDVVAGLDLEAGEILMLRDVFLALAKGARPDGSSTPASDHAAMEGVTARPMRPAAAAPAPGASER